MEQEGIDQDKVFFYTATINNFSLIFNHARHS